MFTALPSHIRHLARATAAAALATLGALLLPACGGGGGGGGGAVGSSELSALTLSAGSLTPPFSPSVTAYTLTVSAAIPETTVTATCASPGATIEVNGGAAASGAAAGPIALAVGLNPITIEVTGTDTTVHMYTVVVTRETPSLTLTQDAYAKAGATHVESASGFGVSVAISGTTMVVGAHLEDDGATADAGVVHVFRLSGTTWAEEARLVPAVQHTNDAFGISVAIDGNTLVVGAYGESSGLIGNPNDTSASAAGAAYVFTRSGTTWSQQAYLKPSNPHTGYQFGASVAISGDTLAVGSPNESSIATGVGGDDLDVMSASSGAAFVFTRSGVTWTQQAYVKATNTETFDHFGQKVALDGDTLAVSAPGEDSNSTDVGGDQANNLATSSGAVYTYTRVAGVWSPDAYLKATNTGQTDNFGFSLALSGDTLAVGAPFESSASAATPADNTATFAGAAYVYTRTAGVWSAQQYLKAAVPGGINAPFDTGDNFGNSISIDGDTLVIGAAGEDGNATTIGGDQNDDSASGAGAVYAFTRSGSTWTQAAYIKASNGEADDHFGTTVAVSGLIVAGCSTGEDSNASGIDGDGSDNSVLSSGAAYIFD